MENIATELMTLELRLRLSRAELSGMIAEKEALANIEALNKIEALLKTIK